MQTDDQEMIGQMLGPYRLEAVLGHGGMGLVYLARQTRPARYVAVKVLQFRPEMGDRSLVLARFQREANTAAMLEHIHIIPIFDYGELADMAYLVMPYVNGGSLSDVLQRQGKLPLAQAFDYLQQAASALDYAHAYGVIHRDLKPSNFLLYPDGRLVLADFGIARILEGSESSSYITLSTPNSTIGTPSYMSPEMAYGMPIDTRADIYSLGIVFFQMLSGHVPFQGIDPLAVLYMHVSTPLPSLHAVDPTLPAGIDTVLQKATAKSSKERYASAGDMVKDLQSVLQQSSIGFMPQTPYASDLAATYVYDAPQRQSTEPSYPGQHRQSTEPSYPGQHQQSTVVSAGVTLKEPGKRAPHTLLKVLPLIILIVIVVFLGALRIGGVFAFPFSQGTPNTVVTPTSSAVDLAKQAVTQYYDNINQRNYRGAYDLLAPNFQRSLSYSAFEKGYSDTIRDDVTFNSAIQNSDGSVSVSTTLNTHEIKDGGSVYETIQWNARLVQVNGAWRIESAKQW